MCVSKEWGGSLKAYCYLPVRAKAKALSQVVPTFMEVTKIMSESSDL